MYDILKAELINDPLGRNYAGMQPDAAAASLNTVNRTVDRDVIPAWEVAGAIVWTEYTSTNMTANARSYVQTLVAGGTVNVKNANVRAAISAIFPASGGSAMPLTRANMIALQTKTISRADELGLGRQVEAIDVIRARA